MKIVPFNDETSPWHSGVISELCNQDVKGVLSSVEIAYSDGGAESLAAVCCHEFTPQVGDKVQVCIDEDHEIVGWIVTLLKRPKKATKKR
jgi:hypothetical protein